MFARRSRTARTALAAGLATALVALTGCSLGEWDGQVVTVGSTPSLAGVGVRNTVVSGQFEQEGLKVVVKPIKSGNDAVPQLLGETLQIAQIDTTTAMQAISKGLPITIIGGAGEQSTEGGHAVQSTGSVLVTPGSDITTMDQLSGRKMGIHAINSQIWMNIRATIDHFGGDSATTDFVEVPAAQSIDMLLKGEVEATTASEPVASAAVKAGKVRLLHSTDVPGHIGEPSSVYVATDEFIEKHPDIVEKFVAAVRSGQKQVNDDHALAKRVAIEQLKYKPKQVESAFFLTFSTAPIDPAKIEEVARNASLYGVVDGEPLTADELLTEQESAGGLR